MVKRFGVGAAAALLVLAPVLRAEPVSVPPQTVHLSASAQQEVAQDWLTVVLQAQEQAPDAATVQQRLKTVLTQAMAQLKPGAEAAGLQLASGGFQVFPRHGNSGQVLGWQGRAELWLQGRDVAALSRLAGRAPGMAVEQMRFSLSREAAQAVESSVRQQAIARFRADAQEVAQAFGFAAYRLQEVQVRGGADGAVPRPRTMAPELTMAAARSDAPLPAEPGQAWVQVTVSGRVQLTP